MSQLCSPLLDLTDDEVVRLAPDQIDQLERDALRAFKATRRYTQRQWSYLVETHNDSDPSDREKRRAVCVRSGKHDWRGLPMDGCRVCQRCLSYTTEDQ